MTSYRVVFTATAERHLREVYSWRRAKLDETRDPFRRELERAVARLSRLPLSGTPYPTAAQHGVRRLLLRRSDYHLYYTLDGKRSVVAIRAVWHTARGGKPTGLG